MHEVVVQYKFDNHGELYIDKYTTWKINLIFRPVLTPHEAPLFLGDKLPSLILLDIFKLNEYEFQTGPASEDTISATFSVAADSKMWLDFITVDIDPDTNNMKFKIFPTLPAHIGTYELRLMLIDNASDRKSGLTEYETALPKTTVFKVPV